MKANENGDILCFPSQEYKRTWEFDAPQEESSVFDRELSDLAWNFILEEFFSLENNPIDKLLAEGAADFEKNIKFIHTYFLGQGYLSEFRNFKDGTEIIRLNFEFPSKYGEWESYLKAHQPENLQSFYNFMKTVDNIVAEMKKAYPQVTQKNLKDIEKLSIEEKIGLSFELVMMSNRSHEFDFLKKNFFYIPTLSQEDFSKKISKLRKKVLTKLKQDPIHAAAYFHVEFVNLHPFKDGNGRTARAIMNIILMGSGIDAVAFPSNREYMEACFAASEQKSEVAFENFLRKIILEQKENANELEQVSQVLERCEDQCQEMIDDKILF
ncbi:MAG: Fic family protein [Myxococcales bacterium]|nr:MAG: Fic family protein [Myxococcales bacterium]